MRVGLFLAILAAQLCACGAAAPLQSRSADDADADAAEICKRCGRGEQQWCDRLVDVIAERRENVCAPPAHDEHASPTPGEYLPGMYQGDIRQQSGRAALSKKVRLWHKGIVYYEMSHSLNATEQSAVRAAMKHIEQKTCVRFKPHSNQPYWVVFKDGWGCNADLGRQPKRYQPQSVTLSGSAQWRCTKRLGTAVHEMLHALGFVHEQNRPDRDQFVTIDWSNVMGGYERQFEKEPDYRVSTRGTQYDYGSVMHYDAKGFAKDLSRPVITPHQQGVKIGQRDGLSSTDSYEVNLAYDWCRIDTDSTTPLPTSAPPVDECKDASWCPGYSDRCAADRNVADSCRKMCRKC